ncbi:MAG: Gldg family protein [Bacteroidetes bacterium]|nr:Gldg family protein [Bacteroidota bacterium]
MKFRLPSLSTKWLYVSSILIIVVISVILINILANFSSAKIDMTEDKRYSLSEPAENFLNKVRDIEGKVFVEVYLGGELPAELRSFKELIQEKLEAFKDLSKGKIDFKFIDPKSDGNGKPNELELEIFNEGKGVRPVEINYKDNKGIINVMRIWPGAKMSYNQNGVTKEAYVQFIQERPGGLTNLEMIRAAVENSSNDIEYLLASGVRELILEKKKRIGFLQGHGELRPEETKAAKLLLKNFYYMTEVNINDTLNKLDEFDAIIIADPKDPFSEKDLYVIDQFVMRGGNLMVFMNTLYINEDSLETNLGTNSLRRSFVKPTLSNLSLKNLLFDYGINIKENLVMDANCFEHIIDKRRAKARIASNEAKTPFLQHVLATPSDHLAVKNLNRISLKFVNEVSSSKKSNPNFKTILSSSNNSLATRQAPLVTFIDFRNFGEPLKLNDSPESEANRLTLAAEVSGTLTSYFIDKLDPTFANNPESKFVRNSVKPGKIIAVGNGTFLANSIDSVRYSDGTIRYLPIGKDDLIIDRHLASFKIVFPIDNAAFLQNLVDYMLDDNAIFELRSRKINIKELDRDKIAETKNYYTLLNIGIPVLLICLIGLIMTWYRRKKYTQN